MSLTSFAFVFFVCCVIVAYRLFYWKWRWMPLIAASAVFYISYSRTGFLILVGTSLLAYVSAVQIQKIQDSEEAWLAENRTVVSREERKEKKGFFKRRKNRWVVFITVVSVGLLILFKYYGYFADRLNRAFSADLWTAENLLLPLGISFYSLQLIGYVVDVSRGIIKAETNPLKVILYASFFLSIMQGPFNRYHHLMPQICDKELPKLNFYKLKLGILKITFGYIKKMCIADQLGIVANEVFSNYPRYSGLGILLGVVCFAVQLYADFSGYMDIVSGIGELLGIEMPINFRQPFFSRSISEFWQRWHITLGAWLKDYVLYPILKSKGFRNLGKKLEKTVGKEAGRRIPTYIAMLILWTLIGLWHGAGFNYVFSVGLLQFFYIFLGEITVPISKHLKNWLKVGDGGIVLRIIQSVRCTALMIFAWVFFNSKTFMDAVRMLGRIFAGRPGLGQISSVFLPDTSAVTGSYKIWLLYIFLCIIFLFVDDLLRAHGVSMRQRIEQKSYIIRMFFYLGMIFAIIIFGAYGEQYSVTDFIYFQF